MQVLDTVIIGAGQCGLYTAKQLQDKHIDYLLLERNTIGQVWEQRLSGLRLFTSRQFCQLPGLSLPGSQNGFPEASEMGRYLKSYANRFKLHVRENAKVSALTKQAELFLLTLESGEQILARTVINATGSNQTPNVPQISQQLSDSVIQLTAQMPSLDLVPNNSNVVVVGDGASGRQIAGGLAKRCRVSLATGTNRGLPPNKVLGKDLFWWLKSLGILDAGNSTLVAKLLKKRNPVPCADFNNKQLKKLGVAIKSRLLNCAGNTLSFADGNVEDVDMVIWATGYKDNTEWLKLPHCMDENGFIHSQGKTPEPGLFIIGRKWFSCRGSELVLGVAKDVNHIVSLLESHMETQKEMV
ncbi:flavin-containing monooxygenase [Flocculibacter collagenilyticus]|uniref:flavin-containing monooxygenase n=1 Tax=Flocculibacter collagenilyticus TaxID=2744479 RepID=UPI0018F2B6A6|nr:NAD(P)/FAD-dependent oxidoreductase [Flocculibacter collagenilyticus]